MGAGSVVLRPGEGILQYTDGITEAVNAEEQFDDMTLVSVFYQGAGAAEMPAEITFFEAQTESYAYAQEAVNPS